jgi:hypothetical protein
VVGSGGTKNKRKKEKRRRREGCKAGAPPQQLRGQESATSLYDGQTWRRIWCVAKNVHKKGKKVAAAAFNFSPPPGLYSRQILILTDPCPFPQWPSQLFILSVLVLYFSILHICVCARGAVSHSLGGIPTFQ